MGLVVFFENWKNPNIVIKKPNSSSRWVTGKANILPEKPLLASRRWTERHTEESQLRCLADAGRWILAVPGSELWRSVLTLHSAHTHSRTLQKFYREHQPRRKQSRVNHMEPGWWQSHNSVAKLLSASLPRKHLKKVFLIHYKSHWKNLMWQAIKLETSLQSTITAQVP